MQIVGWEMGSVMQTRYYIGVCIGGGQWIRSIYRIYIESCMCAVDSYGGCCCSDSEWQDKRNGYDVVVPYMHQWPVVREALSPVEGERSVPFLSCANEKRLKFLRVHNVTKINFLHTLNPFSKSRDGKVRKRNAQAYIPRIR